MFMAFYPVFDVFSLTLIQKPSSNNNLLLLFLAVGSHYLFLWYLEMWKACDI